MLVAAGLTACDLYFGGDPGSSGGSGGDRIPDAAWSAPDAGVLPPADGPHGGSGSGCGSGSGSGSGSGGSGYDAGVWDAWPDAAH
jgi:hypothetical protein